MTSRDPFGLGAGCRFNKGGAKSPIAAAPDRACRPPPRSPFLSSLDFFGDDAAAPVATAAAVAAEQPSSGGGGAGALEQPRRKRRGRHAASSSTLASSADEPLGSAGDGDGDGGGGGGGAGLTPPSARQVAEANQLRKALRIHVYGNDIPLPVQSAHELSDRLCLRPFLYKNMMGAGYHELTRVQMQVSNRRIENRYMAGCASSS